MLKSLVVTGFLLVCVPLVLAEPFLLNDPTPDAGPTLNGVAIGGAPHGFLLAGTGSHKPVAIPIDDNGKPRLVGTSELGLPTASRVGEPLFVGDRWLVPISPDFLNVDRFFLAEMRDDGTLLRAPRSYSWPHVAFVQIGAREDALLAAGTRSDGAFVVRTLSVDLETLGEERVIAQGVRFFRLVPSNDGFLLTYATDVALHLARFSSTGEMVGSPVVVASANNIVSPDVIAIGSDAMIVWAEPLSPGNWSLRSARVSTTVDSNFELAMVQGSDAPALFIRRTRGDVIYAAWQGIDNAEGRRVGALTYVQTLGDNAQPLNGPREFAAQDEVLVSVASSGDLLLAWEKRLAGVGISLEGVVLGKNIIVPSGFERPVTLRLSLREPYSLELSRGSDGNITAVWIEKSSIGQLFFVRRFDRDGRRLQDLGSAPGRFRAIDVASGAATIMLVWQDGPSIYGSIYNEQLRSAGTTFLLEAGSTLSEPRVTWDGSRYIVVYVRSSEMIAAAVSTSSTVKPLGTVARLTSSTSTFFLRRPRVAANEAGIVIVASAGAVSNLCAVTVCPEESYLTVVRVKDTGEPLSTDLQATESDPMPDVATDGRDFVVIWRTEKEIRTRMITDSSSTERSLIELRSAFGPVISWSGSEYAAAWTYQTGEVANTAATMLDQSGNIAVPVRMIRNADVEAVAALPGDALLGWISGADGAVFGEFFREADAFAPRRRAVGRR